MTSSKPSSPPLFKRGAFNWLATSWKIFAKAPLLWSAYMTGAAAASVLLMAALSYGVAWLLEYWQVEHDRVYYPSIAVFVWASPVLWLGFWAPEAVHAGVLLERGEKPRLGALFAGFSATLLRRTLTTLLVAVFPLAVVALATSAFVAALRATGFVSGLLVPMAILALILPLSSLLCHVVVMTTSLRMPLGAALWSGFANLGKNAVPWLAYGALLAVLGVAITLAGVLGWFVLFPVIVISLHLGAMEALRRAG